MNDFDLEQIFELMGSKLKRPDKAGNRSACCPLAPWLHTKGRDKSPSLTAKAGDPALYRCWACGSAGTLFNLAQQYGEHSGDWRASEALKSFNKGHLWGKPVEYGIHYKRVGRRIQAKLETEITEEKLQSYLQQVPEYAFERGIQKQQVLKWEIGFDRKENRMIFPVRDYMGKLQGVSGRALSREMKPKYKHYPGLRKESVLYGERYIDRMVNRAYIVEGFLDVLALERNGMRNALGSMGTSLSDDQMKKIDRWFREVVFLPDCDDQGAGLQFAQTYGEKLFFMGKKVGIAGVQLNEHYVPREKPRVWEPQDYRYVPLDVLKDRDPGDLKPEELQQVVSQICWVDLKLSSPGNSLFG